MSDSRVTLIKVVAETAGYTVSQEETPTGAVDITLRLDMEAALRKSQEEERRAERGLLALQRSGGRDMVRRNGILILRRCRKLQDVLQKALLSGVNKKIEAVIRIGGPTISEEGGTSEILKRIRSYRL